MVRSSHEAAQDLVSALTEACEVDALQTQRAETARHDAEATREQALSFLAAVKSDPAGLESRTQRGRWLERIRGDLSSERVLGPAEDVAAMSARRQQSLNDSWIALMRLYAFPEARDAAEIIAEVLRTVCAAGDTDTPRTMPVTPLPHADFAELSEVDRKKHKAATALDFMHGMDAHVDAVLHSLNEKRNRVGALLAQAREEAEALAQRLNA